MTDIRQSPLYAAFINRIGWQVEKVGTSFAYIKKLPFIPTLLKIQRPNQLPAQAELKAIAQKYGRSRVVIEPLPEQHPRYTDAKLLEDGFTYSKSITVDINKSEIDIFATFADSKRRGIKRAEKLGVKVVHEKDINTFIHLKKRTSGLLGFLTVNTLTALWKVFSLHNAFLLLATEKDSEALIAGLLILVWDETAYYWQAAATDRGKKLHVPSLLVWEAIKEAKKRKCRRLNFDGVYDERFPKINKSWQGFTKFKMDFGGTPVYYPQPVALMF